MRVSLRSVHMRRPVAVTDQPRPSPCFHGWLMAVRGWRRWTAYLAQALGEGKSRRAYGAGETGTGEIVFAGRNWVSYLPEPTMRTGRSCIAPSAVLGPQKEVATGR